MRTARLITTCFTATALLQACAIRDMQHAQDKAVSAAESNVDAAGTAKQVVQFHDSAWLMGEEVAANTQQPDVYDVTIEYNYAADTLDEVAQGITKVTGIPVTVDASAKETKGAGVSAISTPIGGASLPPLPPGVPTLPGLSNTASSAAVIPAGFAGGVVTTQHILRAHTKLGAFVQQQASRFGVWSKYKDGAIVFFRTETRGFDLPTLGDKTELKSTITTSSGSDSSSGSGSTGSSGSTGGDTGSGGGNSQQSSLSMTLDPFATLQSTATAVSNGGTVIVDKNLGMLIVTGTPPQCDAVEKFMKKINADYGKLIALDVRLYTVELNRGENYGLDLSLAYKGATGHSSAAISGAPSPALSGGGRDMSFGASILSGPFAGTQGAVKMLSTLGNVTSSISTAGVANNGKKTTIQAGEKAPYLPSQQSTLAANVGSSTSSQSSFFTTGFTGQFTPKLIDGRIAMDMTITVNRLIGMVTLPPGCTGSSCLYAPDTKNYDLQSSATLKPGESLVLVGMRQDQMSTQNNGVGSPFVPIFGGGIDASQQHTLLAVVVTARVQ